MCTVSRPRAALALVTMALAQFMVILDDTVVNVALPNLGRDLAFSPTNLAWVVNGYMLTFGGCMLLFGRMADLIGRRHVFVSGALLFTSASLCSGLAHGETVLIAARAAQGLGAAALTPSALAIVLHTFTQPDERRRVMGLWSGLVGVSGVLGVLIGGFVTDTVGWRWVFLLNVPVGVLMILGVFGARLPTQERGSVRDLDVLGALLSTGGLSLLSWTMLKTTDWGWCDPKTVTGLGVAVTLLAVLIAVEAKVARPLLNLRAFASAPFAIASLATMLLAAALFSLFFFLTQYMQMVQGFTPWQTGVHWIPWSITLVLVAGISTKLLPKVGARIMVTVGALVGAFGFWLCTRLTAGGSYTHQQLPALICMGVGIGLAMLPLTVVLTRRAAASAAGEVSAVMSTLQQIGGALGVASLTSIAVTRAADAIKKDSRHIPDAYVAGFHGGFWMAVGIMTAVAALGFFLPTLKGEVTTEDVMAM